MGVTNGISEGFPDSRMDILARKLAAPTQNSSESDENDYDDEAVSDESSDHSMSDTLDPKNVFKDNKDDDGGDDGSLDDEDDLSIDDDADDGGWMDVEDNASEDESTSSTDDESLSTPANSKPKEGISDDKLHANPQWANAMAKILRTVKPKGKKNLVLANAKKLSQISSSEPKSMEKGLDFEIDGAVKEEETEDVKPKVEDIKPSSEQLDIKSRIKRRNQLAEGKVKPSVLDRERERALSKIATKGVVQLFNAVRQQQKEISSKLSSAGGSIRREEKVMQSIDKRSFLDVLMGDAKSERVEDLVSTKKEEVEDLPKKSKPASWNVLRDDYMMGGSLKDWDKLQEIKMENDVDEVRLD